MIWRWIFSLAFALVIHLAWLCQSGSEAKPLQQQQETSSDWVVAEAEPVLPPPVDPPTQPDPVPAPLPEPVIAERFRPTTELDNTDEIPQTHEAAEAVAQEQETEPEAVTEPVAIADPKPVTEEMPESEQELATEAEAEPVPVKDPAPVRPQLTSKQILAGIAQYRKQLSGQFDDQFKQVPELHTTVQDQDLIPRIDLHFGITTLAYSYVDHKPGPPFILFEETHHQKLDDFDFSRFSNRIKDRMLYRQYRTQLNTARQQYDIHALMKMIGLVPTKTDQYFSAKQLRAVQLAGLNPDQVKATNAHYEPHGADGFTLIIDSVVTQDGRVIPVRDEELQYCIHTNTRTSNNL